MKFIKKSIGGILYFVMAMMIFGFLFGTFMFFYTNYGLVGLLISLTLAPFSVAYYMFICLLSNVIYSLLLVGIVYGLALAGEKLLED